MGKIIINLGREAYSAQAGDAFYYTANKKHSLENKSDKPGKDPVDLCPTELLKGP